MLSFKHLFLGPLIKKHMSDPDTHYEYFILKAFGIEEDSHLIVKDTPALSVGIYDIRIKKLIILGAVM